MGKGSARRDSLQPEIRFKYFLIAVINIRHYQSLFSHLIDLFDDLCLFYYFEKARMGLVNLELMHSSIWS